MPCPTCTHRKPDGTLCGSPALPRKRFFHFHQRDHKRQDYAAKVLRQLDVLGPRLPRMRNLVDIQEALYQISIAIANNRINLDRAGTHLFALQQRSATLRDRKQRRR